mmetsp:Transcript_4760/g.8390  ORF Transcript_4760/g.8390 Transcript_4760/m.8390 type:complete len:223 (+) Transcript_4760:422-1090(+)
MLFQINTKAIQTNTNITTEICLWKYILKMPLFPLESTTRVLKLYLTLGAAAMSSSSSNTIMFASFCELVFMAISPGCAASIEPAVASEAFSLRVTRAVPFGMSGSVGLAPALELSFIKGPFLKHLSGLFSNPRVNESNPNSFDAGSVPSKGESLVLELSYHVGSEIREVYITKSKKISGSKRPSTLVSKGLVSPNTRIFPSPTLAIPRTGSWLPLVRSKMFE